jgi:hypothetical protein
VKFLKALVLQDVIEVDAEALLALKFLSPKIPGFLTPI